MKDVIETSQLIGSGELMTGNLKVLNKLMKVSDYKKTELLQMDNRSTMFYESETLDHYSFLMLVTGN